MHSNKFPAILFLSLLLSACQNLGPNVVREGRNDYNEAINNTALEELLLNIVRLRYTDSPYSLQVATITSRAEIEAGAGVDRGQGTTILRYAEKPSIVYTPLTGEDFVRQLLTRIDLDSLYLMYGAGWELDDIFRVFVNYINGVPNASIGAGPTPEGEPVHQDFQRLADLLDQLDDAGVISLARSKDNPDELVLYVLPNDSPQLQETLRELKSILQIDTTSRRLAVRLGLVREPGDDIVITTRPIAAAMFFLGHATEMPASLTDSELVHVNRNAAGEVVD